MDRQAEPVGQCHQHPALGSAVEFGHHEAGHIGQLQKRLDLAQRVLAGRRIQHQQGVVRRLGVFLADDADDLRQFLHQILTVLQAARRVDQQKIGAVVLGFGHRVIGQRGGIGPIGRGQHRHPGPLPPDLQLFHRGGTKGVTRRDHHLFAGGAKLAGQLADGGGLARPVDPDHQNHLRALGIKRQRPRHRGHDPGDLGRQNILDFGHRQFAPHPPFGKIGGDPLRRPDPHVGADQQLLKAFEHRIIQRPPCLGPGRRALTKKAAEQPGLAGRRRFVGNRRGWCDAVVRCVFRPGPGGMNICGVNLGLRRSVAADDGLQTLIKL